MAFQESMNSKTQWRIQDFVEVVGANSQDGYANLLFCKIFPENCIKMKEFGPRKDLDPPMKRRLGWPRIKISDAHLESGCGPDLGWLPNRRAHTDRKNAAVRCVCK